MARVSKWLRVVLGALALVGTTAAAEPGKVLLVVREGSNNPDLMISKELVVMIDTIKGAGLVPVVASLTGREFVSRTAKVKSDLKLADVRVSDYVAVVVPCMAAGEPGYIPPLAVKVVRDAAAAGLPIAAQRSGLYVLSEAGLLKGKKYTYSFVSPFPEGIPSQEPVVRDGNVITSATCPNAAKGGDDTTVALIKELVAGLR